MKKLGKMSVTTICVLGLLLFFGCAAFQDIATPCHIDQKIIEYSNQNPTSYLPWTTLFDAKRIMEYANHAHDNCQQLLRHAQENDILEYNFCRDTQITYNNDAEQFKQQVFDASGPIGMLVPMLFGGTLGALFINTPKKNKNGTLTN